MPSTYVPPKGPLNAPYAIVGEQPGRNEVLHRELGPFSGPAGRNLQDCLHAAGILWQDCYRTNVIKDLDAPLSSYIEVRSGKNAKAIVTKRGEEYIRVLRDELGNTNCNIIVACGNVALWALCSRIGITNWRGSILESTLLPGRKVIPTIHPATWTREKLHANPDAYLNKYLVILDLKRAKHESAYPEIRREPHKLLTNPTYYEVLHFIECCIQAAEVGATIDYDIELQAYNQELSCIGLAYSPEAVMCIPFIGPSGDTFNPNQELAIMQALDKLFSNNSYKKRGQNVIFDSHYLLKKYGIRTHNLEDTMIAQGILYPELRKGLDTITSIWTDIPYYKRDGKLWLEGGSDWQRGWEYNCLDVISCAVAHPKQICELKLQGNLATYERQRKLIPPLTYMMEHGIKIDIDGMHVAAKQCTKEIEQLAEQVSQIIKRTCIPDSSYATKNAAVLNLSSPDQLAIYFYNYKGIKPYINKDTGRITVDITALTRIANQGHHEASLILRIRQLAKRKSTFLDTSQVDPDGRMRCQYNPVGTKFGRVSSSENIFGTGTNHQNQPHDVLTHFIADDGYVVYSLDMSQIESRIVAYVGNIAAMIEAFEKGIDLHRLTAAMTLSILGQPRTISTVSSEERQEYGKRPNHAFNYGYGYRSYALRYEVPESDAKRIHTAYHAIYPALRNSYWTYIQQELKETRALTTLMNRKILFLGLWSDKLLHDAYSAIPQSTCGDHVNERGIEFIYYNESPIFQPIELLLPIHDSIDLQIPLSVPLEQHAEVLIAIKASLETPLEWRGRKFVVPVDLVIGKCLNKDLGVEVKGKNFSTEPKKLTALLASAIERLGLHATV